MIAISAFQSRSRCSASLIDGSNSPFRWRLDVRILGARPRISRCRATERVVHPVRAHAALAAPKPPNIVFILADDIGIDGFGCYGSDRFKDKTPNVDALASFVDGRG